MIARVVPRACPHAKLADASDVLSPPGYRTVQCSAVQYIVTPEKGRVNGYLAWNLPRNQMSSGARSRTCLLPPHMFCRICLGVSARGSVLGTRLFANVASWTRSCVCGDVGAAHTHTLLDANRPHPGFVLISNKGASRDERAWLHVAAKRWSTGSAVFA